MQQGPSRIKHNNEAMNKEERIKELQKRSVKKQDLIDLVLDLEETNEKIKADLETQTKELADDALGELNDNLQETLGKQLEDLEESADKRKELTDKVEELLAEKDELSAKNAQLSEQLKGAKTTKSPKPKTKAAGSSEPIEIDGQLYDLRGGDSKQIIYKGTTKTKAAWKADRKAFQRLVEAKAPCVVRVSK